MTNNTISEFISQNRKFLEAIASEQGVSLDYVTKRAILLLPYYSKQEIGRASLEMQMELVRKIASYSETYLKTYPKLYQRTGLMEVVDSCKNNKIAGGNNIVISADENDFPVVFKEVDSLIGDLIQENLHYINSKRTDTKYHLGLFIKESSVPFAYASFSACQRGYQVGALEEAISRKFPTDGVFVMTRAFCFDGSPKNSMSKLFQQAQKYIKEKEPQCRAIVTAVNPALGFEGGIFFGSDYHIYGNSPMEYWYDDAGLYVPRSKGVYSQKLSTEPIIWLATGQNKYVSRDIRAIENVILISKTKYKEG